MSSSAIKNENQLKSKIIELRTKKKNKNILHYLLDKYVSMFNDRYQ